MPTGIRFAWMRFFTYRHSWRGTIIVASVTITLLLVATQVENDILASLITVVALVGFLAWARFLRTPVDRPGER
jgi:hypothetical protein